MKQTEEIVTLQVPASAEYIDLVRLTLYGLAVKIGFSYEEIEDMKVAVSEACNNAVLYAYEHSLHSHTTPVQEVSPHIEVRFIKRNDALSIVVKDDGRSFNAATVSRQTEPMTGKTVEELQTGGLGLFLMQALMDHVEVKSDRGTEVTLTKRLIRSGEMA